MYNWRVWSGRNAELAWERRQKRREQLRKEQANGKSI